MGKLFKRKHDFVLKANKECCDFLDKTITKNADIPP